MVNPRRILIALAALLLSVEITSASGAFLQHRRTVSRPQTAGSGDACSSCTNETFEGTGTVLTGWSYGDNSAGTVTNVDYTTAPAPLAGSQSLLLRNGDSQAARLAKTVASSAAMGWRIMFHITNTITTNMQIVTMDDNVGAAMASFRTHPGGLEIRHGTANAATAITLTANQTYYSWGYRAAGSGANGVGYVAISTSKIKPTSGSGYASVTTGTTTANAQDFGLWVRDPAFGSGRLGIIIDEVYVFPGGEPGDFP